MISVSEHYESLLAPVYLWMAGGFDAATRRGQAELEAVCPHPVEGLSAIDLGAGFGMHAIPLARLGCTVTAIDSSACLLGILRSHAGALPVRTVEADFLSFMEHVLAQADLILCMGDTVTHLPSREAVAGLFADVASALKTGGTFVVSFRDYTSPLIGAARFIPVRSDADRILTCLLEYGDDTVLVNDMLYERNGDAWQLRVSAYSKLRLSIDWVSEALRALRFRVRVEPGLAGMVRIVATAR
jgi:SAM-dependent methyltransferase